MKLAYLMRFAAVAALLSAGCAQVRQQEDSVVPHLRQRALDCLKRGIRYEYLPTVRAQAIEAMQNTTGEESLPWIRLSLQDEHPGVRFAACMALGARQDQIALPVLSRMLDSDVSSDRIGAIFALHRLGYHDHTADLAGYLFEGKDMTARCNAALVLGRLGEPGAIKLLARVMNEPDPGLQANALEAMLILGAREARSTLYANAYHGVGSEETFAVTALAKLCDPTIKPLFDRKLKSGMHLETRLAAARALGMLGHIDGYKLAAKSLHFKEKESAKNDPAANRTLRVRQMAALALGAIGDTHALPALETMMNGAEDPRLQIAAAKAILDIIGDRATHRLYG